ncbi:MAG: AAA family ATPase, partial [Oligoflexia bacterium]|nr:AAA family ATPase [Oligoflexia bacterium]
MKDLEQIKSIIAEQNPWWKVLSVPDYLAPSIERPLAKYLWKYILRPSFKRYLIILGPRRVGKTTVMYQTVRHLLNNQISPDKIQWVRLDHPLLMPLDLGSIVKSAMELSKATKDRPLYSFLDELVYAEKWDLWLKTFYDEHWPVHIIASSSATA